jgi:hypothetical protein
MGADTGGNSTTTVVTFSVELLLYTALLTATCWFVEHYAVFLRMPALVFLIVDPLSVMASASTGMLVLFFALGNKASSGGFADGSVAQATQGFAVAASIMWGLLLACMFIKVPHISTVPGDDPSASVFVLAVVTGFSIVTPLLAMIVTYASVPGGQRNSLVFNGAAVGSFCVLFLVILALGNGGVSKCFPYAGAGTSFVFKLLVSLYGIVLYALEIIVFSGWDPLNDLWSLVTGAPTARPGSGAPQKADGDGATHFVSFLGGKFGVNYWRMVGLVVNEIVLATALSFTNSDVHVLVAMTMLVVAALHVPLVFRVEVEADDAEELLQQEQQENLQYIPEAQIVPEQVQQFPQPQAPPAPYAQRVPYAQQAPFAPQGGGGPSYAEAQPGSVEQQQQQQQQNGRVLAQAVHRANKPLAQPAFSMQVFEPVPLFQNHREGPVSGSFGDMHGPSIRADAPLVSSSFPFSQRRQDDAALPRQRRGAG